MAEKLTAEQLNKIDHDTLAILFLNLQEQLEDTRLTVEEQTQKIDKLIEQLAVANNNRYGRSTEKLGVIEGQLELELFFNEAEALTETVYVVESEVEDPQVPMDNNSTEGALRSFCLHKHTWKLIDTIDGAKSSAIIYSIVETAKGNNLHPFRYLEHILTVMANHQEDTNTDFMEELMPRSESLPEICRMPK